MHMAKAAAILGSSGGNLYNLGGKDPESLLGEMVRQIKAAGIQLAAIQFIAAEASMDTAKPETKAALWTWDGEQPRVIFRGTLEEVNREAVLEDEKIAGLIDAGKVDGLILASCDPKGANARAMAAAAEKKLAATGTGGTSMALAQSMGLNVVAVSGTTGTTNRTRAIANVFALAKFWNLSYRPAMNGGVTTEGPGERTSLLARISVRGILMASLPGFIAMALTLILSKVPGLDYFEKIFNVMIDALPVIVATVAAKQVSGMGDVAIVAGVVTGILSVKGGLIGGIIGGIIAGILVQSLLLKCLKLNFPATTANIVAGGIAGLAAGLLIYLFIAPLAEAVGNGIRYVIDWAFSIHPSSALRGPGRAPDLAGNHGRHVPCSHPAHHPFGNGKDRELLPGRHRYGGAGDGLCRDHGCQHPGSPAERRPGPGHPGTVHQHGFRDLCRSGVSLHVFQ